MHILAALSAIFLVFLVLGLAVGVTGFIIISRRDAPTAPAATAEAARRVMVVVLGDIGRSPRMQYHALSLIRHGFHVDMIGYRGAEPLEALRCSPLVQFHYISEPPRLPHGLPRFCFLLYAPFKVLFQVALLTKIMIYTTLRPQYILVQNPPAIPVLALAQLTAAVRHAHLIIDWHNFGYTILALTLGKHHLVVRIAELYEHWFGNSAYAHLTVTNAMAEVLRKDWNIRGPIFTLYDRAPEHFSRLSLEEQHSLFMQLSLEKQFLADASMDPSSSTSTWPSDDSDASTDVERTLFTERSGDSLSISRRPDSPALIVSSTSWTADEDFGILLDAVVLYDQRAREDSLLPPLVLVITGKGPLQEHYKSIIRGMSLHRVRIATVWLAIEDYPRLLGAADLGISLHASSSGLDLPMKVVDMFGCGLPVCALQFDCIDELVVPNHTGLLFRDKEQLATQLQLLLRRAPDSPDTLERMRHNVVTAHQYRWTANWNNVALPLLTAE